MTDPVPYQVSKQAVLGNGSFVTIHTVNTTRWLRFENIHLVNATAVAVTVQFCIVPAGGAAAATNALLWNFSIPANDFIEFGEGLRLGPGGLVRGSAGAGNAITATVCGVEKTLIGV